MPWVAAAAVVGGAISAEGSKSAANAQAKGAARSLTGQQVADNQLRYQQMPWMNAGESALNQLQYLTGTARAPVAPNMEDFAVHSSVSGQDYFDKAGYDDAMSKYQQQVANYKPGLDASDPNSLLHRFDANDLNANLAPNWQFALQQGQGATQNLANLSGGLLSGNTMKGIQDYTIGKSGDLYQQAYNNYTQNQSNIFNRLSTIAGYGQTANQQAIQSTVPLAQSIGQTQQSLGASQAAGIVGQSNAISGGLSNAGGWYGLNNLINRPQSNTETQNVYGSLWGD